VDPAPPSDPAPEGRGGGDSLNLVLTGRRLRSQSRKQNRRHPADLPSRTSCTGTPPRRGPASLTLYRRYRCEPRHPSQQLPSAACLFLCIPPALCPPLDPITARPSPIEDGSRPERGPQHTGLLVSRCPHRGTTLSSASRLSAAATPHILTTLRGLGCTPRCYHASDLAHRLNEFSLHLPLFMRGQR
jgi:hypothetical protein